MSLENLLSSNPSSGHLPLHGAIVLVYALLLGAPYGRSANRGGTAKLVYFGNLLGAGGSLVAAVGLLFGALRSL